MGLIVFILALSVMIFIHELGHFLVARFFGVKVEVFSIGFGKAMFEKEYKGTIYKIAMIPLGGYVRMKGQDDANPLAKNFDDDSYSMLHPLKRIAILLAGPMFNILLSFVIYFGITFGMGVTHIKPIIKTVIPNSAAVGLLKSGDRVIAIDGVPVTTTEELIDIDKTKTLSYTIKRDTQILIIPVKAKLVITKDIYGDEKEQLLTGIRFDDNQTFTTPASLIDALRVAVSSTKYSCLLVVKSISKLISGAVSPTEMSGIVGMGYVSNKVYGVSFISFLFLMALISANLGIINLLPIPALDGGHILFNLYELIFRRELTKSVLHILTFVGWALLFVLLFFTLYNDIVKIFTNTLIPEGL